MTTPTSSYRTHIGLGELADITAQHSVKTITQLGLHRHLIGCECGTEFDGYSEHAFHLATEAVRYANGRKLDRMAEFDLKHGTEADRGTEN